jgi:large subunit ribosomal protein L21
MFAIIKTGGKQYKVREGDEIEIEKLEKEEGEEVVFEDVLLVAEEDGEETEIGTPNLDAVCKGEVLAQTKDDKVVIFKFKPKTNYKKKKGHRQPKTKVRIDTIEA